MNDEYGLTTTYIHIKGMHCERCVRSVQASLLSIDGVDLADVDLGRAEVRFLPQLASTEDIERAIRDAGYDIQDKQTRKGLFGRFIERMIKSNIKTFGNQRLDCCNLEQKKK